MATSKPTTRTASQSYRRQALIWLIVTLLLGVVTALVWMFSQTPTRGTKIENAPISAPQMLSDEFEQPLKVESLHELDTDVQPISFEMMVRDLRNYPAEFKDKRYLLANKGKWTVQVMNVVENDVIVNYLEGRKDRDKFAYFRYLDDEKQVRYMLTYGIMSSPQEAVGAAKLIDFKLPTNVRVLPEEINRYVGIIDNYARPDPIKDLSAKRTRAVDLEPTKREVPVRQKAPKASDDDNTDNGGQKADSNRGNESIRQSADTSATLSVTEERIVGDEEQEPSVTTLKNEDSVSKPEQDNKKPALSGNENTVKKPPVVPTPKPPAGSGANNSSNATGKNANPTPAKNNNDSMKALIEDKSN
ncbi:hypothetical protein [Psychrobacter sp. APC 3350]|uniref:hypothetical protein n=1 Tax=Psychrobacter sp. APC 3350 TaxID=3035195 RepID=UPI0025B39A68|nr:hypothetical protein [Psychrobacter sp. APC 3350]MDN3452796.1 hypothetical protein [Psychrobacter sp. APC 3350]